MWKQCAACTAECQTYTVCSVEATAITACFELCIQPRSAPICNRAFALIEKYFHVSHIVFDTFSFDATIPVFSQTLGTSTEVKINAWLRMTHDAGLILKKWNWPLFSPSKLLYFSRWHFFIFLWRCDWTLVQFTSTRLLHPVQCWRSGIRWHFQNWVCFLCWLLTRVCVCVCAC